MKLVYWLLLVILIVIFGSNYTSAKFALKYSTPIVFSMLRTALGCAFTIPFAMYTIRNLKLKDTHTKKRNPLRPYGKSFCYIVLFGITSSTFFFGFWYAGEAFTSASITSVIVNT